MLQRLGINLLYLVPRQVGGTEIAARRFVAALAAERPDIEIVVFCGREAGAELPDPSWPSTVRVVTLPVDASSKPRRVGAELARLPSVAAGNGVDLLHSFGTTSPLHGRFVRVTTIQDLIYDRWPTAFPTSARLGLKLLVPLGARRADRLQVSSTATRDEVVASFGTDPGKIDVVPLGLGMSEAPAPAPADELRRRLDLGDRPVLLSVAAALPHKNLDGLLEAFATLPPGPVLVLTGHAGRVSDALHTLADRLGVADRVRFTGWLSESELEGLYGLATAFVYPSLHEGFGMPVLEAMHRGTPVVSSNATSLPEVAGDAAVLVDASDPQALADALARVLADASLRNALIDRGRQRAAGFGWDRTARAALESYGRAMQGGSGAAGKS